MFLAIMHGRIEYIPEAEHQVVHRQLFLVIIALDGTWQNAMVHF